MGNSFLKAERGDPVWMFSPAEVFDIPFKIVDANTIHLDSGQQDSVILRHSPSEKALLAKSLHVSLAEDSALELTIINDAAAHVQQVCVYNLDVQADAMLSLGIFVNGGKLNKHIFQISLADGASVNIYGYVKNADCGDSEIIMKTAHHGIESYGAQFILAEAGANSQAVSQSMLFVNEDSEDIVHHIDGINFISGSHGKCYGYPHVHNSSQNAQIGINTVYETLNADQLFYMEAHGVSSNVARTLIINGYRQQALSLVQDETLRAEITQLFE